MMTQLETDLLLKVKELEKENEKLEGAIKTGRNANQNLSSLIIGLTADNERLTKDNKKLAKVNSKLYEENLKLAKDKQHLWERVVSLVDTIKSLREMVIFKANDLKDLADFVIPGGYDDEYSEDDE